MKKHPTIPAALLACLLPLSAVHAEEDIYADYNADVRKPADAKANKVYSAWANNMAYQIEHGNKDGVVINGEGDYADGKVHADGVGNVKVDKNANVGPIVNKTEIENSTVIIQKDEKKRSRW